MQEDAGETTGIIKAMGDQVSTASWNLVADSLDCGIKTFDAIADTVKDKIDWTHDLLAARSPSDLVSVWSRHSARQMIKGINQGQAARDLNWKLWADCVAIARETSLLPAPGALQTNAPKAEMISPEEEVLLLHVIE